MPKETGRARLPADGVRRAVAAFPAPRDTERGGAGWGGAPAAGGARRTAEVRRGFGVPEAAVWAWPPVSGGDLDTLGERPEDTHHLTGGERLRARGRGGGRETKEGVRAARSPPRCPAPQSSGWGGGRRSESPQSVQGSARLCPGPSPSPTPTPRRRRDFCCLDLDSRSPGGPAPLPPPPELAPALQRWGSRHSAHPTRGGFGGRDPAWVCAGEWCRGSCWGLGRSKVPVLAAPAGVAPLPGFPRGVGRSRGTWQVTEVPRGSVGGRDRAGAWRQHGGDTMPG